MTASISKTMRAIAIDRIGGRALLRELPTPVPGDGEVLIKVLAAGVNPLDLKIQDGTKAVPVPTFPHVLGQDCAGVVVQRGPGVSSLGEGSEVFGAFWLAGAFAEYVCVNAMRATIAIKPHTLDFNQAAALPTPALAANSAVKAIPLSCGQTILINGATGSIGNLAIQMARLHDVKVIATARDAAGMDLVRRLGASEVVDYANNDVLTAVRAAHPDGIDALIDMVSDREALMHISEVLRPAGHIVSTVHAADSSAFSARCLHSTNVDVFGTHGALEAIARLVDDYRMIPPSFMTCPFETGGDILDALASKRTRQKVVLTLSGKA